MEEGTESIQVPLLRRSRYGLKPCLHDGLGTLHVLGVRLRAIRGFLLSRGHGWRRDEKGGQIERPGQVPD